MFLLRVHVTRSFSSHGTSFLAFCLVTLTVLSAGAVKLVTYIADTEKHSVHSTPCANLTAQLTQKEKEDNLTRPWAPPPLVTDP